jgi:cytochrome bd ubiquinol oxidase subunit I
MDAVFLARIQFGLTAGFHFIFPPISIGLILIIVICELLYLKTDRDIHKTLSTFLIKIFGLVFTIGVATGIVMEFSFGNNWSQFSRMVGDIFGVPLAAEVIFAFFLESVFLGVLLWGREKVSKKFYFISALLVLMGSHLSAFFIIIAHSWMQTPAGFMETSSGRIVITDFFAAVLNHSTMIRFFHVILASWITGSLFTAGISSWYLLKKKSEEVMKPLLSISLSIFIITSLLQFISGHMHSVQVANTQREKMAAFEALWKTEKGAPLALFGIPDAKKKITYLEVSLPKMLSFLIAFDTEYEVTGLDAFPEKEQPPVFIPYMTYHIMITLGSLYALISFTGIFLILKKILFSTSWFHKILLYSVPLPIIASEAGWTAAEVGRQPWVVYHVMKTSTAASPSVPAWQILLTIVLFTAVYLLIFAVFMKLLLKLLKNGPGAHATRGY